MERRTFRKKLLLLSFLSLAHFFYACSEKEEVEPATEPGGGIIDPPAGEPSSGAPNGLYPVACACNIGVLDWTSDNLDIYRSEAADWSLPAAKVWSFKPSTSIPGGNWTATESAAPGWDNPTDMKMRLNSILGPDIEWIAAVGGETALITNASKVKKWSTNIGSGQNPQSIEILGNGNVAVAAAGGNWVKVFATRNNTSATYPLYNAHSVLWDETNGRLWATGQLTSGGPWSIVAFTVGTGSAPALELDASRTFTTDQTLLRHLSPVVGQPDKFWVSAAEGVFFYNKVTKTLSPHDGKVFNKPGVTGTSNQPSGEIIQVEGNSKVNVFGTHAEGTGVLITSHLLAGNIYKAVPLNPNYEYRKYYGIATFNVRVAVDGGNKAWSVRRPLVRDLIRKYDFDIWGSQEANGNQITHLANDLPEYNKIGTGRDDDGTGPGTSEHSALFYKKQRFAALASGQFWLAPGAPTTKPANKPWGTSFYRIATFARLRDRYTGEIFWVFNAHFDHASENARVNSANLMLAQIAEKAGNEPAILLGDLNAGQNQDPYLILHNSALLSDAYQVVPAAKRYAPARGTTNGFDLNNTGNRRIDHIMPTATWQVYSHNVLTDAPNSILPSDHYPVLVEMKLP
ncbi:DUF6528 family protein [Rufibacter quisquiliarum]|uniref:Endonuclease/exonuclease/phosphatase family metal-dependent hydrolase n=1 Tax=Rufibacter quisquiliarum TaxID=1549639 RepID=A0A839GA90_9BACT|nr:DUF6528 family protein [Rufibacter quisquiliarum]MBA9075842.1 endonuclease/exonuclease/phosphatase family metal-dependent hydrolase [Rufibacter quisquiliarum]